MKASLRSEHPEWAPWKCRPLESVENSNPEFPTLSTGLGNPAQSSRISTFPPRRRRLLSIYKEMRNEKDKTEFQLTDSITSSTIRTPASLRSENDQLHLGTSDWDQIGITDHLHRNRHFQTLAIERRAAEVWGVLGAVKTEFGKFGDVWTRSSTNFTRQATRSKKLACEPRP